MVFNVSGSAREAGCPLAIGKVPGPQDPQGASVFDATLEIDLVAWLETEIVANLFWEGGLPFRGYFERGHRGR